MIQYRTAIEIHTQTAVYKNVGKDVLSWSTTKRYGTPAGSWQMQLSTRPDDDGKTWFDKLSPQDFVRIRLVIGDRPPVTVMNGLINRVSRNTSVSPESGEVRESISVMGLDLGKILTKFSVWYNPYPADDSQEALSALIQGLAILTSEFFEGLSIKNALQTLLDLVTNRDTPAIDKIKDRQGALSIFIDLKNKGTEPIYELLKLNATVGEVTSDVENLTSFTGTLWNGFRRWANEPWNELFVDNGHPDNQKDRAGVGGTRSLELNDDRTYINLRPAPFTKERFERLVTHEISYEDIGGSFASSKGDDDTYTGYFAYPSFLMGYEPLEAKAMSGGTRIIQRETGISAANRYGFRLLDLKSIYVSVGNVDDTQEASAKKEAERITAPDSADQVARIKELTNELVEFFDPNPTFLQGTITLKPNRLKTLAKIGQRLRIKENPKGRPNELYYIVGVRNNWTFGNAFTQTLELKRGVTENV